MDQGRQGNAPSGVHAAESAAHPTGATLRSSSRSASGPSPATPQSKRRTVPTISPSRAPPVYIKAGISYAVLMKPMLDIRGTVVADAIREQSET